VIINLFSIFDPSTSNYLRINWLSLIIFFIIFPLSFWAIPSRVNLSIILLIEYITSELKNNLNKRNFKSILVFFRIFIFIITNNILGLFPYIFTATSHLVVTLSIALPIWILLIIYGWINFTNHIFTHLVPLGTPIALSMFIVFIESIRNIIRPITLSVRLAANIIAGHLLLRLLRGISERIPVIFIPSSIVIVSLLILEYAVAIIQRYVFITLSSLYLNEIN